MHNVVNLPIIGTQCSGNFFFFFFTCTFSSLIPSPDFSLDFWLLHFRYRVVRVIVSGRRSPPKWLVSVQFFSELFIAIPSRDLRLARSLVLVRWPPECRASLRPERESGHGCCVGRSKKKKWLSEADKPSRAALPVYRAHSPAALWPLGRYRGRSHRAGIDSTFVISYLLSRFFYSHRLIFYNFFAFTFFSRTHEESWNWWVTFCRAAESSDHSEYSLPLYRQRTTSMNRHFEMARRFVTKSSHILSLWK